MKSRRDESDVDGTAHLGCTIEGFFKPPRHCCLPRAGFAPNHNLYILVEGRQQVHQTFDGKPRELVVPKRRHFGLRDSQHLGSIGLKPAPTTSRSPALAAAI
jgi:hypothetical protein